MATLSPAQKIYTTILLTVLAIWLALLIGVPAYEYVHGKNALAALLEQIKSVMGYAVVGIGAVAWLLQRIGVLPAVQPNPAATAVVGSPVARLRNLVFWIVIALLLVFLFNLFQGPKGSGDGRMADLFINYAPMAMIVGIWIFLMFRMNAKKKKDLQGGNSA